MPPRVTVKRSIHLPSASSTTSIPRPPHPSTSSTFHPKPHLASYHLQQPSAAAASSTLQDKPRQYSGRSPVSPQLPQRRQPAFNPGGFGLQFAPTPAFSGSNKGKGREKDVLSEIEKDENQKEGHQEAEACYVPPPTTLHYHSTEQLPLLYSPEPLPPYSIAYESWGKLNADRSNAILLHTGLSASSHVASNGNGVAKDTSGKAGWWEDFVGPDKAIDTNKFFVICTNVLGGCFGSTGPSSPYPLGEGNVRWATRFPLLSIHDMTRAQLSLLDDLGINKLYASIGSSMGGMQSLSLAYLAPERVGRVASISAAGRAGLGGVGMRYAQRSVLMADPNWNRGFYYDAIPPHNGMKLARQIATITYRSGPEWEERFGRKMLSEKDLDEDGVMGIPRLSPDFLIETYLDHQGERFCLTYDANSMIYLSKAMDLFDMTAPALTSLAKRWKQAYPDTTTVPPFPFPTDPVTVSASTTSPPGEASSSSSSGEDVTQLPKPKRFIPTSKSPHLPELAQGLQRLRDIPTLVLGVQSDILFPVEQQRELADALKLAGNEKVTYYELGGVWGHDTFLLDLQNVGGAIRGFLH